MLGQTLILILQFSDFSPCAVTRGNHGGRLRPWITNLSSPLQLLDISHWVTNMPIALQMLNSELLLQTPALFSKVCLEVSTVARGDGVNLQVPAGRTVLR